jgi:hypothetical protein
MKIILIPPTHPSPKIRFVRFLSKFADKAKNKSIFKHRSRSKIAFRLPKVTHEIHLAGGKIPLDPL